MSAQKMERRSYTFARRVENMGVSAIREILKVTEQPEVISFAGGLPAPELFPVEALAEAHARVFAEEGAAAMQYSTTEGWRPLREWIARRLVGRGIEAAEAGRVLITSGSQQGIDLAAKAFITVLRDRRSSAAASRVEGRRVPGASCPVRIAWRRFS